MQILDGLALVFQEGMRHQLLLQKAVWTHLQICTIAMLIAAAAGLPLGFACSRNRLLSDIVLGGLGTLYTIPSLAMLAILVPWLGLGKPSAILALVLYAQFILLRSMVSGLNSVDFSAVEAARGLGLSAVQIFRRVEAPMAMPIWINGLRNATLTTLSIATTAAWINAGGLGTLIFDGLSQNNIAKILMGALLISGLSLLLDYGLKAVEIEATQIANGELA